MKTMSKQTKADIMFIFFVIRVSIIVKTGFLVGMDRFFATKKPLVNASMPKYLLNC